MRNIILLSALSCLFQFQRQAFVNQQATISNLNNETPKQKAFRVDTGKLAPLHSVSTDKILKRVAAANAKTESSNREGTTYYLSSTGNDNGDGLSPQTAWKSIDKINSWQFVSDTIVIDGTINGVINLSEDDVLTPLKPIVIKSLNERATIGGIFIYNIGGIEVRNLSVIGSGADFNENSGITIFKDNSNSLNHIYIDSVNVSGFGGSGIIVGSWETETGFNDVRITNVLSHNNGRSGIESYGYNDFYSHTNVYIGNSQAYENYGILSVTTAPTGSGIVLSSVNGALIERCKAWENGKNNRNAGGGPVGIWFYNVKNGVIQNCESFGNKAGLNKDGGGFDIDGGCQDCTIQFCKSYNNEGPGYLLAEYGSTNPFLRNVIRNNTSMNDGLKNNAGSLVFWAVNKEHSLKDAVVENNVFFINGSTLAINFVDINFSNVNVRDNTFYIQPTTVHIEGGTTGVTLSNNLFIDNGVLPVLQLFFSVRKNANIVDITWHVKNEEEFASYEVQKGYTNANFTTIQTKTSTAKPQATGYQYVDVLSEANKTCFYRLKILGKNGQFFYSETIPIFLSRKAGDLSIALRPMPLQGEAKLAVHSETEKTIQIAVVNSIGTTLLKKDFIVKTGNNSLSMTELSSVPKGIYWLVANSKDEKTSLQFVKQ